MDGVAVMARAQELGFRVNKPYGDSAPYNVAVEEGGRFQRVQVKCTDHFDDYAYRSVFHTNERRDTKEDVDFFAIYVIPEKAWYIFPAEVLIRLRFAVRLNPRNPKQKYARYLEAWPLLRSLGRQEELEAAATTVPGGEERKLCDAGNCRECSGIRAGVGGRCAWPRRSASGCRASPPSVANGYSDALSAMWCD
jgi:hypothetical protein